MFTSPNAQAYGGASAAENPFDYLAQAQNRLGQRNYRDDLQRTQQQEAEMARLEALNNALAQAGDWFASGPVANATPNPTGRIDDISQYMIQAAGGPDMNFSRFQDGLQEQMSQGRAAEPMVSNFATMAGGVSDLANAGQVYPGGLDVGGMSVGDFSRQTSWGMTPDQSAGHAARASGGNNDTPTYQWRGSYPVDGGTYITVTGDVPVGIPREQASEYLYSNQGGIQPTGGSGAGSSRSFMPENTGNPLINRTLQQLQRDNFEITNQEQIMDKVRVDVLGPDGRPNTLVIDSEGQIEE